MNLETPPRTLLLIIREMIGTERDYVSTFEGLTKLH